MGLAAVFFIVSVYWAILYRMTWELDWAALATFSAMIASIIGSLDLFSRRKYFRRMSDSTIKKELGLVLGLYYFCSCLVLQNNDGIGLLVKRLTYTLKSQPEHGKDDKWGGEDLRGKLIPTALGSAR